MNVENLKELENRLGKYLREVLSISLEMGPWEGAASVPVFLREAYGFAVGKGLDAPCLFLLDRDLQPLTPVAIRKHVFEVGKKWTGDVVYVARAVDSSRRKQLIDQRVPFVVPGNQAYLPMLGTDLREHFRHVRGAADTLGPATQAVLLHALHHGERDSYSPRDLASALGYSGMTLTRAFNELESAGIGRHYSQGKRRLMELKGSRRALWEIALPLMRSPVTRRVSIEGSAVPLGTPAAGLSALAIYTNLAEPDSPVSAVTNAEWAALKGRMLRNVGSAQASFSIEIELWSYPPASVVGGKAVDRLSLYLSLRETRDERIEAALEDLLEGMQW
jgi:hypothetical protein